MTSWRLFEGPVLLLLGGAVILLSGLAGMLGGASLALIFLSASALCATIGLMWHSLTRMGESNSLEFEDALEMAAPTATEEQKLAVLRALKDLEYELFVGKISREDFEEASTEYRNLARQLIAAQDVSMKAQLDAAERRVSAFLQSSQQDTSS